MKKLLILTNLIWLSFFVFTGFKPIKEISLIPPSSNYHLVDASLAKTMADSYRKSYINITKNIGTKKVSSSQDSRSIWFSLDMLKSFIVDIETQGSSSGVMPSGLRFYFIQYPANIFPIGNNYAYFDGVNPSFQNLHSLMSVPTYLDRGLKVHVDYDPRKGSMPISDVFDSLIAAEKRNKEINKSISNSFDALKANVLLSHNLKVSGDDSDPANIANKGQMIPPPFNTRIATGTNVPCSGANLMIYFDGNTNCGFKPDVGIKDSEKKD